jgi:hypothetical protein
VKSQAPVLLNIDKNTNESLLEKVPDEKDCTCPHKMN